MNAWIERHSPPARQTNPWIERHRSHMVSAGKYEQDTTITDRCEILYRLDRDLPLGLIEATIEELESWLARPRWSRQTKATYYGHIVGFYRWAADPNRTPHLSFDPSSSLSRPKVPDTEPWPVTNDELSQVFAHAQGMFLLYCLLAAYAGLRPIQICNLTREHVTEEAIIVKGKGGKTTTIPTHPEIWAAVRDFPRGPIATVLGRPATPDYVSNCTSRHLNKVLGPNDITLRRLRHWFGTTLLLEKELGGAGANLRTVQELMGHSTPSTTAIYTKITERQRRIAVSALPLLASTPS